MAVEMGQELLEVMEATLLDTVLEVVADQEQEPMVVLVAMA